MPKRTDRQPTFDLDNSLQQAKAINSRNKGYRVIYPDEETMMMEKLQYGFTQWDIISEFVYLQNDMYNPKRVDTVWNVKHSARFEYDGKRWNRQ